MGPDTELDFDKYCKVVRNPRVGRISRHHRGSKAEARVDQRRSSGNYLLRNLDDNFAEISFGKSRTFRSTAYNAPNEGAGNEVLRRGSVYQDSKTRQKIELSPSGDDSLSFRIFDSALLDKNSPLLDQRGPTLVPLREDYSPNSEFSNSCTEIDPPSLQDLSFRFPATPASSTPDLKDRRICTLGTTESEWRGPTRFKCDQTAAPLNDGNGLAERDAFLGLHKSLSEKPGTPYSPCRTESECSRDSSKSRVSPFRRMLNPIMKSKSLRSSSVSKPEQGDSKTVGSKNRMLRKSLLNDFLNTAQKDENSRVIASSPAHLRASLTVELKHGVPYFEFACNDSEDVLSARTWRANNGYSWVYTFHATNNGRTSNSGGRGTRERQREPSMIGQMQVSCFLLSEMKNNGGFDNSTVTEFVLYNIMHARRNAEAEDDSHRPDKSCESKVSSDLVSAPASDDFDCSTHYPWTPTDLHPHLEIAAIVIQVPFEKRESLKDKRGSKLDHQNLLDFSTVDHRWDDVPSSANRANVKVVIPAGSHGLPNKKTGGAPSPLLERWRSGGCCDCGGWDMACPLLVSETRNDPKTKDRLYLDDQQPVALCFQGAKDKIPALTVESTAEGRYSVDFHARLSKLQAFSICVAVLHGSEASAALEQEKHAQPAFPCNSLKVLLNEEARFLMEAVADKEKRSLIARA